MSTYIMKYIFYRNIVLAFISPFYYIRVLYSIWKNIYKSSIIFEFYEQYYSEKE